MSTLAGKDLVILGKGLSKAFIKAFDNSEMKMNIMPFILETNSTSNKEDYGWLGHAPSLTEWVDERKLKSLNQFKYEIENKDYEATLSIDRNAIEDDQLGNVNVRINDLALKAKNHPVKLFIQALKDGETELCYDGQPFFSASHEEGASGVQSNIVTGTGTSLAQLEADIDNAETRLLGFKDDTGEPWNEGDVKIGVVCHTSLKNKFIRLNTLDLIDNTTNSMKGRISQITYSSRFDDVDDWYMADINDGMKPLIMQNRKSPTFESQEADSSDGFMRKKFHYGIDYRVGFGYGLWQKMVKVKN